MNKLIYTLQIIYKNRYRKLTHKDASFFWFMCILYFLLIIKLINGTLSLFPEFSLSQYILGYYIFTTCQFINNRTDWETLSNPFNNRSIYLIYFLDLLTANSINILVAIYLQEINILYFGAILILFFTFYKQKRGQLRFKLPFNKLDVLLVTNYRRFKINFIVLLFIYYLCYQGLVENNRNLFTICFLGIVYINYGLIIKTEKLDYFVLSKLSNKQYILKNELSFFIDCFITCIPCIILTLFLQPFYVINITICFLIIPSLFPLKYIFINHSLPIAFSSMFLIILFLTGVMNTEIDWYLVFAFIPISIFLHYVSFRKFTKEIIQNDSEFYL